MKTLYIIITFFASYTTLLAQEELIQIGASGFDGVYDVAIGKDKSIYTTGFFQGTLEGLKSKGNYDAFVAKYNTDQTIQWIHQLGSEYRNKNEVTEFGKFIVTDSHQDIYVTGLFYDQLEDKNKKTASTGKQDIFIVKYDQNGTKKWTQTLGSEGSEHIELSLIHI